MFCAKLFCEVSWGMDGFVAVLVTAAAVAGLSAAHGCGSAAGFGWSFCLSGDVRMVFVLRRRLALCGCSQWLCGTGRAIQLHLVAPSVRMLFQEQSDGPW